MRKFNGYKAYKPIYKNHKNIEPKKEIKKAIPFPKHQKLKYLNLMHKNYTLKAAKIIEIEKLYQQKVTQM